MDTYFSLPGLQQLPFQRQLSRLYNDTKRSSDFVKEPLQNAEDPEIKALHRKLRIQKDRLVSWGLEWSDPSQSEVLIDSSLSRAGLSEVVGSIMSTIKDTLAEVEPLWLSSKQMVDSSKTSASALDKAVEAHGGSGKSIAAAVAAAEQERERERERDRDRKRSIVAWDRARFNDLIQDLTVSIDTLYDLSRTRSSAAITGGAGSGSSRLSEKLALASASASASALASTINNTTAAMMNQQHAYSPHISMHQQLRGLYGQSPSSMMQLTSDEAKLFESSRMRVPQQIDSTTLTIIESATGVLSEMPTSREVVFMNEQAYADLGMRPADQKYAPLLLEYAYFDPVYSSTGIMPSMDRFEKLSAGLGLLQGEVVQQLRDAWSGNPRLLGYFEDMDHSRLGLVYQFPAGFHVVAAPSPDTPSPPSPATLRSCLYSLGDLLGSPGFEPRLEAKFRLASNLANAVFEMHAKGIAHGNLVDASILFGRVAHPDVRSRSSSADVSQVDLRKPVISSFDLFPDTPGPSTTSNDSRRRSSRLHQHPLNPAPAAPGAPPLVDADPRVFDLYSLAMLLLSIGMWTRLENLVPHRDSAMVSEAVLEQLATQCGTLYMKAVQTCWNAMETVVSAGKVAGESHLARLQVRASSYLEACCVLDDVGKLEERLRDDLGGDEAAAPAEVAVGPPVPSPSNQMRTRSLFVMPPREQVSGDIEVGPLDAKPPRLPPKTKSLPTSASAPASAPASTPVHKDAKDAKDVKDAAVETETREQTREKTRELTQPPKEKTRLRLYPQVALPADVVEKWHSYLMPQVNYALRHFYRSHPESVEISLEAVGESARSTRPTVVVVCTSVSKVRGILKRKMGNVFEGTNGIGLKVCTGRVMRSHKQQQQQTAWYDGKDVLAANIRFQQKPENGASIGAWIGDRHLPPVSFGGLVLVDDKPYGMTVHHMLDDPDATEAAAAARGGARSSARSSAAAAGMPFLGSGDGGGDGDDEEAQQQQQLEQSLRDWYTELQADASAAQSSGRDGDGGDEYDDYACEFSDTSSLLESETDNTSEWSADSETGGDDNEKENEDDDDNNDDDDNDDDDGDVLGVKPGYGEGYIVTQPALDDVDGNFYPDAATQDEDHLASCGLGDVYASSGVRRRRDERGLVHEIDWALFEFMAERQPQTNVMPHVPLGRGGGSEQQEQQQQEPLRPTTVAPASALPGLEVQCIARTSGLQTGRILPTITSVKLYGRTSPSHTYQISATVGKASPIGIPGDSGAWIVEREHGRLCGHVLAWSARKRVAYLCPMDVLLLDIAETLDAGEVRLPGGDVVVKILDAERRKVGADTEEADHEVDVPAPPYARRAAPTPAPAPRGTRTGTRTRPPMATQSTSSLTLHESWELDGTAMDMPNDKSAGLGEDGADGADGAGGTGADGPEAGRRRWQPSMMMELVGNISRVGLGSRGGSNVQAPC